MAHLFYDETLTSAEVGAELTVTGAEAHHAAVVSRIQPGEQTLLGNGAGLTARLTVTQAGKQKLVGVVDEVTLTPKTSQRFVLVQALAKGDRAERAVEQATEFEVDEIYPWQADRSVSRWNDQNKQQRGRQKWQRIAREASKQSLRAWQPRVHPIVPLAALAEEHRDAQLLVLHPEATERLAVWAEAASADPPEEVVVVVGPEGGMSSSELADLTSLGARHVRLGQAVLRTSSAGPAALAVLSAAFGRW